MYLLLVALAIISLIHSLLIIFVMHRNSQLEKRMEQLWKRKTVSRKNRQHLSKRRRISQPLVDKSQEHTKKKRK